MEARLSVEVYDFGGWYAANIIDIKDKKFLVKYADPLFNGQEELFEESKVRWSTLTSDVSGIEYNIGDYIEVKHRTGEDEPEGW